ILARARNCPGVTPTRRLKWWENWLWSENPARAATSARDRPVPARKSCLAHSPRRRITYWWGGSPAETDCAALARYIATVLNGLAVQAASGATEKELRLVSAMAMRAWPS